MAIKRLGAQRFSGLEADVPSLPIDADLVGAIFSSTDTLKFWIFNGTTWNESAGGGGITGINTNSTIIDHSTTLADYTSPDTATATSEDGANVAANAVDESTATFWKSLAGVNESITIDMGSVVNDFALAFYIDKTQTGITETQFQVRTPEIQAFDSSDLKAYWQFNELSGDLINVSTSVVTLGTGADIQITGATYNETGILGGALLFDGVSDFGDIGTSLSQFNFCHVANHQWSIVFWYKSTNAPTAAEGIIGNMIPSSSDIGFSITAFSTRNFLINIVAGGGNKALNDYITPNNVIPNDTNWNFYCMTFDDTLGSNNFKLYVNGNSVTDQTTYGAFTGSASDATNATELARLVNSTGFLDGQLDEISFWDRILTTDEIAEFYNSGDGMEISSFSQPAQTLRTVKVIDLVDQQYNFIRFNGVNADQIVIEGSSGSSLVMAANDLQVLVEADPPLVTAHGQFEINGTNDSLALNGGDPVSSVIEDPQVNSLTLNNVGTQGDPISGASVMWQQTQDANNDTTRIKMKINGSIEEVRFF